VSGIVQRLDSKKANQSTNAPLKFCSDHMTLVIRFLTLGCVKGEKGETQDQSIRRSFDGVDLYSSRNHRSDLLRCPRKLCRTSGAGIVSALSLLDWMAARYRYVSVTPW